MAARATASKFHKISELNTFSKDDLQGLYVRTIGYLLSHDCVHCTLTIKDGSDVLRVNTKYIEPFPFRQVRQLLFDSQQLCFDLLLASHNTHALDYACACSCALIHNPGLPFNTIKHLIVKFMWDQFTTNFDPATLVHFTSSVHVRSVSYFIFDFM